jgi:Tol biopolymer transport system component
MAFSNSESPASTINAVSSDGSVRQLTSRTSSSFVLNGSSISRDGRRFTLVNDREGTWVVSGSGKILHWLSRKDAYISPDGRSVAWEWDCGGVCVEQIDNPNARRLVKASPSTLSQWSWSPDSRSLLVSTDPTDGSDPVEMMVVDVGGRSSREISSTKGLISAYGGALEQEWSPDSRFVAFTATSRRFPPSTLFVARADGSGAPVSLATATTGFINWLAWRPVPSRN